MILDSSLLFLRGEKVSHPIEDIMRLSESSERLLYISESTRKILPRQCREEFPIQTPVISQKKMDIENIAICQSISREESEQLTRKHIFSLHHWYADSPEYLRFIYRSCPSRGDLDFYILIELSIAHDEEYRIRLYIFIFHGPIFSRNRLDLLEYDFSLSVS